MFISNSKFYVKSTISSTQGTGTTFKISEDFETGQHIDSDGEILSIVLKTSTQIERMTITCVGGVATIVKRGLTQADTKVESAGLKKQWTEGTIGYVTALASDLLDIDRAGGVSVLSNDIDFTGEVEFKGPTRGPTFADETARDLVYTSPVNSDECFIVGIGKQVYSGGEWKTLDEGTPTPNASTTVAGKVEIAIDSEITAGTNTGGTGAPLSITPAQIKKSISLKTAGTTFGDTNEISVNIGGEDFRITGANLRESIPASETLKGTVQRASNAEATAGTNNTKFMTPLATKNNYSYLTSTASESVIESELTEYTNNSTDFILYGARIKTMFRGVIRVTYDMSSLVGGSSSFTTRTRIAINGNVVGTERTKTGGDTTYTTYTEDISVNFGDEIQLFLAYGRIKNLYIKGTLASGSLYTYKY